MSQTSDWPTSIFYLGVLCMLVLLERNTAAAHRATEGWTNARNEQVSAVRPVRGACNAQAPRLAALHPRGVALPSPPTALIGSRGCVS